MISYQKLTEERLDTFISMCIRQLREEGVLLYTDFGFKKNGNFMQYKL